jgi:nifR3 family TIM-barrel protein
MADMTDAPFCRVVKSLASPIIFREMISSEAIVRGNKKTLSMAKIHPDEHPLIQQIFGKDPDIMAQAAKIIEETFHPDGIDINMGCPVYKMISHFNGAALMKDPDLAFRIVEKGKSAITIPLSIKIRTGWSKPDECIAFSKKLEEAGADLISIHGRTKIQGYSGKANWEIIREVKKQVSLPVLVNGDISSADLALQALQITKCDGVLIGRAALGNPWIFSQIEDVLANRSIKEINLQERIRIIKQHLHLHLEKYGSKAIITFRKHLCWYLKSLPNIKSLRIKMVQTTTLEEIEKLLNEL